MRCEPPAFKPIRCVQAEGSIRPPLRRRIPDWRTAAEALTVVELTVLAAVAVVALWPERARVMTLIVELVVVCAAATAWWVFAIGLRSGRRRSERGATSDRPSDRRWAAAAAPRPVKRIALHGAMTAGFTALSATAGIAVWRIESGQVFQSAVGQASAIARVSAAEATLLGLVIAAWVAFLTAAKGRRDPNR